MALPLHLTHIAGIPAHWAAVTPDAPAVWEDDQPTSYAALQRAIEQVAERLTALGVTAGERVMIVSENGVAQITLLFAAARLNAWPMVINARLSAREVDALATHVGPRVIAFTEAVSPEAAAHARRWSAQPADVAGRAGVSLWVDPAVQPPEPRKLIEQVGVLMATSGSTGLPKGVLVTHRGLLHFCRISAEARRLLPADVTYGVLPISHIFGMATQLLSTLYAGASLYLAPRFMPEALLQAMAQRGVSILLGVPTMFVRLLAHLREQPDALPAGHRLRYAYTGAAALELPLKREFEALFGCAMQHGYGMTEYAGSMFITRAGQPRDDGSAGFLNDGCQVRFVGRDGDDVARGEVGEIWIRGTGLMLGYYRALQLTAEAMRPGGWFNTGDLGRLAPDGALFVVGRSKEMIIRSGFNVYPAEVEAVLNSHPAVQMSAVLGRRAAAGNEDIVAFVEPVAGEVLEAVALRGWLRERLAPYKVPTELVEVGVLPTLANGKLARQVLRQRMEGGV
jgi:acyl-CoA synthetase (AMP-forming)/AMP-acid ligase II